MRTPILVCSTCFCFLLPIAASGQQAQSSEGSAQDKGKLAQAAQNPISSLISIPFQLNFNGDIGEFERTQAVLNLQPVIPVALHENITLVTRWILPFVAQPDATMATGSTWGFGDFNPQWYLALEVPGGFTIGPGVTVLAPTASDAQLGLGQWEVGPALVIAWIGGPIVAGFLINNGFSVGGDDRRPSVSAFFLQPFINVNLPAGTYLTTAPQITNDWKKDDSWTVPLGLGVGQILELGPQPVNFSVQGYANLASPDAGPKWQVRVQMQLLFPLKKPG
jgi:hypothetical protein